MKIAMVVPSWPPGSTPNGIVTYASYIVPALRRLGHDVYIITPNSATKHRDPWTIDLQHYSSQPTLWGRLMFKFFPATAIFRTQSALIAAAASKLVEKEKIDVLEMEESFGLSFAISRLNLLPVVVRLHGPWFVTGKLGDSDSGNVINRGRVEREGLGIRHAHLVTAPSANIIRKVQDYYGLHSIEGRVIPNAIQAACEKDTWSISTCSANTFLFVGRIDKLKGADVVIRAFASLAARHPRLRLIVVGPDRGIEVSDGTIYSYDAFVRANIPETFRSRIEFLGPTDRSNIMSLRTRCLATIVASRYENMPYSVLEAMSLGCPLIATAVGGIPELITNHRSGILIPSEDQNAMIDASETLLRDMRLAARLGRQAWLDCRDLYAPENTARQTVSAYEKAIERFQNATH